MAKEDSDWLEWQDTVRRKQDAAIVNQLEGLAIAEHGQENRLSAKPSGNNTQSMTEENEHAFDQGDDYEMVDAEQQPEPSMHDASASKITAANTNTQQAKPTNPPHPSPHPATALGERAKSRMRLMHLEEPPSHAGSLVARSRNSEWQKLDKKSAKHREFWERQLNRPGSPLRERRGSSPV